MTAHQKNLYIEQGATYELPFVWREGTTDAPGDPVDLTGATAAMQIRKTQQAEAILDASSTGVSPRIILGGATGEITISLTDADTDALTHKTAKYDLEVRLADGKLHRILEGDVTVSPNITQVADDPIVGD